MVNSSRYLVVSIFEWVVVVAEVGEIPDLLLSMGILVTQRLSDRTRSTYLWTAVLSHSWRLVCKKWNNQRYSRYQGS